MALVEKTLKGQSFEDALTVKTPDGLTIQPLYKAEDGVAVARDLRRATVVPLHGSLPPRDQRRAFQRPPKDSRKVVVSTNVAETSITIDDVVHVVDTGRAREIRYNAASGVASLSEVRVARAATTQRAGRAGRVKPGMCWHAYPEADLGVLPAHAAPEMLRTPLQDLVLQDNRLTRLPHELYKLSQTLTLLGVAENPLDDEIMQLYYAGLPVLLAHLKATRPRRWSVSARCTLGCSV